MGPWGRKVFRLLHTPVARCANAQCSQVRVRYWLVIVELSGAAWS